MADVFLSRTGYRPITPLSIPDFTEAAQDAVGAILTDTVEIDFTYNDGAPSISALLVATSVVAGSYGSASAVGTFTSDSKGRLTAAATVPIVITATQVTDFTEAAQDAVGAMVDSTIVYVDGTPLLTRGHITGDIDIPQASNISTLATVNSNVGTFGSATQVASSTVNAKGLTTAASNILIAIPSSQITDFAAAVTELIEADFTLPFLVMGA